MKQVYEGFVGKQEREICGWYKHTLMAGDGYEELLFSPVIRRGECSPRDWFADDWPPRKVRVTVEVDDGI